MKTASSLPASRIFHVWIAALLLLPSLAHAHVGAGHATGLTAGLSHPFGGLDHLFAMIAVGIWAAQLGGRALWAWPLSFVAVMAAGAMLGMAGIALPGVETGIVASVLVLGVLIAAAARLRMAASIAIVGLFAIFHGHAHGTESTGTAAGMMYILGFMAATTVLHACGIGAASLLQKQSEKPLVRFAGAAIATCGVVLVLR